jgi:hypothetical protein
VQEPFRFAAVGRLQRSLLLGVVLLPVVLAVFTRTDAVFELHVSLHVQEDERAEFRSLESSRGVLAEYARILCSGRALLAILLANGL